MVRLGKLVASVFLVALLGTVSACDSDSPLSPESIAGTYVLISVNGESETFDEGGSGVFRLSGNSLILDEGTEEEFSATISGSEITAVLEDEELGPVTLVFRR